ncbi:MAG: cation:proton antiporter [Bacteroidales bacterium]|nr:cation:proton antiporter [Bacteroidales bacterium]
MGAELIKPLVIILATSALVIYILGRLKISSVVGFLVSGIILGPYVFGFIKSPKEIELFAEIGVILLMFTLGLEFSLKNLTSLRRQIFLGGTLQVVFTLIIVALICVYFLNYSLQTSLFYGMIVSLSSTAIVLKLMMDRAEINSVHGRNILGILIFQDLIAVWFVLLIPVLSQDSSSLMEILLTILKSLLVVAGVLLLAKWIIPYLYHEIAKTRSRELFIITTILISLSTAFLTHEMGLSLALGAFLAGIVISESEYSVQAIADILPLKESFLGMFFISIGMLINLPLLYEHIVLITAITFIIIFVKLISSSMATLICHKSIRISLMSGFYLSQIGEFSFVLVLAGRYAGILPDFSYQLILSASVLTMLFTPFVILSTPTISEYLLKFLPTKTINRLKSHKEYVVKQAQHKLTNHTIVVGFGLNGSNLVKVLKTTQIPYIILELNAQTVKKHKNKEPIFFGDATNIEVLHKFGIKDASTLVVAISDPYATRKIVQISRIENEQLYIIARTRYVNEVDELISLGANEVIPEEFETSLEISSRVLHHYGVPKNIVLELIENLRQNCYRVLRTVHQPSKHLFPHHDILKSLESISLIIKNNSHWLAKSIQDLQIRQKTGATIIAVSRNGEYIINPQANFIFQENDIVMLIGSKNDIYKAYHYFYYGKL